MASGLAVNAETLRFLHDELLTGCLCKSKKEFVKFFDSALETFSVEIVEGDEPGALSDNNSDVLLLCGAMEKVCTLIERQRLCGRVCRGLRTAVEYMTGSDKPVIDFLLCLLLESSWEFVNYASASALVAYLTVSRDEIVFIKLSEKLSTLVDRGQTSCGIYLKMLTFYEKLFISITQSKDSPSASFINDSCSSVHCSNTAPGCSEMLDNAARQISFPSLITTILTDSNGEDRFSSLYSILRILVILVETCSNIKSQILEDPSVLFSLLTISMPVLIWERTCFVLWQSLDFKSDLMLNVPVSDQKLKFSQQFLDKMATLDVWKQIPRSCEGSFCGFGGTFNSEGADSSRLEYELADEPVLRSFLLLNMACLAALASASTVHLEDQHALMQKSFVTVQEFIRSRVPERHKITLLTFYENQDDVLVEMLLYTLTFYISLDNFPGIKSIMEDYWNPHYQFSTFLQIIRSDYNVILDLLISEETCFLLYFLKYLKLLLRDSSLLCRTHDVLQSTSIKLVAYESSEESDANEDSDDSVSSNKDSEKQTDFLRELLNQTVPVFHELRLAIQKQVQKNLFPYNGRPLLKLLNEFDRKFRSPEDNMS